VDDRILALLTEARQQLEQERELRTAPIAIVGVGCRFPSGAHGAGALWRLLDRGVDATGDVPRDRWDAEALYDSDPAAIGKTYVKRGAFLDRIDGFDPEFFGISPREAAGMDPQQRLLLEVSWEALEDAGIVPDRLRGSPTGVWVGLCMDDYARRTVNSGDFSRIDPYSALGNTRSIAAGRIAYVLDLRGPVVQLDTACSSSLVTVHQACQSLRLGETSLALAGGVNLMCTPEGTIALCKLHALAPDGRCKTFDAAADGYARGEGCGILVLKRLSEAVADGDRIYAVIRGSAVNHDGRSNGLTAPNGLAQEAVMRAALANAGVEPSSVGYVETHGTGTLLGDPIEVLALGRVYGKGRSAASLLQLGTLKPNLGHLEGAAGVASLIKVALCLMHERLPPQIHLNTPNPKIPWDSLPIAVPTQGVSWPRGARPRLAGVSSFGISGTNAHALLEEAPAATEPLAAPRRAAELVVLSARTAAALRDHAQRIGEHLGVHHGLPLMEVAHTLLAKRAVFDQRIALAVSDLRELRGELESLASGRTALPDPASTRALKIAFVFPGQGSQWLGMGRALAREEAVFRDELGRCDALIRAETGWSLLEELEAVPEASRLDRVEVVQPVLFAIQMALAALWRSWGIEPHAVVGHSLGEVAASCVAGALSLADGAAVICRRSRLLRKISGCGEMALVELSSEEARVALSGFEDRLSVAVSNGIGSTVVSGDPGALAEVLSSLEARGVFCRRVKVDVASHSPQVEPLLDELRKALVSVRPVAAQVTIFSTVTGAKLAGTELDADYWAKNLRQPVLFARAVQVLMAEGITHFVEVSPHPLLVGAIEQLREERNLPGVAVGSLRRDQPERSTLLRSLGALFVHGHLLDHERLFPSGLRNVELPTYPWQHQRFWVEPPRNVAGVQSDHPLLGARIASASADAVYESVLNPSELSWLADHRIGGHAVVSVATMAELVAAALREPLRATNVAIGQLSLHAPLVLPEHESQRMQVTLSDEGRQVSIHSRPDQAPIDAPWTLHVTARLDEAVSFSAQPIDVAALRRRCSEPVDLGSIAGVLEALGLGAGAALERVVALTLGPGEALAEVVVEDDFQAERYGLHPALLDSALLAIAGARRAPLLPLEIDSWMVQLRGANRALVHVRLAAAGGSGDMLANVTLCDEQGALIAAIGGVRLRVSDMGTLGKHSSRQMILPFHWLEWQALTLAPAAPLPAERWLIVSPEGDGREGATLAATLRSQGVNAEALPLTALERFWASPDLVRPDSIVCLWGRAEVSAEAALRSAECGLLLVHALAGNAGSARLSWVTRDAVAVTAGDDVSPAASTLWGLARTLNAELPELRTTLIDVDREAVLADVLLAQRCISSDELQIAWRGRKCFVPRVVAAKQLAPGAQTSDPGHPSSVLISGGLGALGLELARHLAKSGPVHLVLMGRRGKDTPVAAKAVAELEALGAEVTVAAFDVTDHGALTRLIELLPEQRPLRGVVHAAGVVDNGPLLDQTPERFSRVLSPKVVGAFNLHLATRHLPLDFFVLFSSVAGTFGLPGQGAYAAANAFLDGLAVHRHALGLPASSLAWGPWRGLGFAVSLEPIVKAYLARQGLGILDPADGLALFDLSRRRTEPQLLIVPIDRRAAERAFGAFIPPVWRALLRARAAHTSSADLKGELAALQEDGRLSVVADVVRRELARVLSLPGPASIGLEQRFDSLGLDSLMALELRSALTRRSGATLTASTLLEHPTPNAIAAYLLRQLVTSAGENALEVHPPEPLLALATSEVHFSRRSAATPRPSEQRAPQAAVVGHGERAHGECLQRLAEPRLRVFCFHDAGGTSAMFLPFVALTALGIEVHTIAHRRSSADAADSGRRFIEESAAYVAARADVPYALLGHSLGALWALRLAQRLETASPIAPSLYVASAPPTDSQLGVDPDRTFQAIFGERGRDLETLRDDYHADLALWKSMPAHDRRLDAPVVVFLGEQDELVDEASVRSWDLITNGDFEIVLLQGDHFYLHDERTRAVFLAQLHERLEAALRRGDRPHAAPEEGSLQIRTRRRSVTRSW
jgi:myxalamid-type polyketide synthase MxaD